MKMKKWEKALLKDMEEGFKGGEWKPRPKRPRLKVIQGKQKKSQA